MEKLIKYLNDLPKPEQIAFAEACGTSVGYLRKAASTGQLLNIATCVAIERESKGEVKRIDLRPDDWQANWPELAIRASEPTPLDQSGRRHVHRRKLPDRRHQPTQAPAGATTKD